MKKTTLLYSTLAIAMLFLGIGCQQHSPVASETPQEPTRPENTQRITVWGEAPEESEEEKSEDLRLVLDKYGGATFSVGDKIYAYATNDAKEVTFIQTQVTEVVTEGYFKKGKFTLDVPYGTTLIVCTLVPLEYKDNNLFFPASPAFTDGATFQDLPVYCNINLAGHDNTDKAISQRFMSLGSIMSVKIENSSTDPVTGVLTWSAEDQANPGSPYQENPASAFTESITLKNPSDLVTLNANRTITVNAQETKEVLTYVLPHKTMIPAKARLHFTPQGGTKISTKAKNKKTNKAWAAYGKHIRFPKVDYKGAEGFAWWKLPELPTTPAIKGISTETLYSYVNYFVRINAAEADRPLVWFDANGDGKYSGDSESATTFNNSFYSTRFTVASMMNFYGPLSHFECSNCKLTEIVLEGENLKLVSLNIVQNSISVEKMQLLINSLPDRSSLGEDNFGKLIAVNEQARTGYYQEKNHITAAQVAEARAKGWIVYDRNGYSTPKEYAGE